MDFFETSAFTNHNITEVQCCPHAFFFSVFLVCSFKIFEEGINKLFMQPSDHFVCIFCIVYSYLGFIFFLPLQSFTRLAELVLQANKKDLDLLGGSMNEELNLAVLEEQEGLCNGSDDTSKSCWCWGQEVTFFSWFPYLCCIYIDIFSV